MHKNLKEQKKIYKFILMKETNTKLFNTPLETIYEVEFFQDRNKTVLKSNNLNEFEKEASNIFFIPINCKDNFSGNYDN